MQWSTRTTSSARTASSYHVGEKVELGKLLLDTFSGEWGMEEGESLTPVLRTSNFNEDGSLDYASPAMRCVPEKKVEKKRMVRGDIILEKSGGTPQRPVGIMAFYDSDALALCSNFNQVLRFREDRILPRFAFHQLRWLKDRSAFDRYTRKTTGLQNLQMKKLIELKLRVPQIEVQVSIAGALDEIVGDQQALRQEVASLDSLVKSRFVEMFGDLEHGYKCSSRKLESIAEVGSSKRVFKNELLAEGVPFYRGTEIAELSAGGSIKPSLFISKEHYERLIGSTGKPEIGDLLLPSICPDGQIWCVNTDTPFYFKDGRVLWIRPDRDAVDGVYLRHALSTMFQMSFSIIASGTTFAELKIFILKELNVPLPELKAQKEFVSFVAQVDKSRFAYIWSRTKSVEQALSGPSLTLVIQHIEPQTRSKYRADVLASPSWPSVDAMLVLKTPHVCVLILVGLVEAIRARCLPGVM